MRGGQTPSFNEHSLSRNSQQVRSTCALTRHPGLGPGGDGNRLQEKQQVLSADLTSRRASGGTGPEGASTCPAGSSPVPQAPSQQACLDAPAEPPHLPYPILPCGSQRPMFCLRVL